MAQIGLTLSFSGYTGSLLVVWKKASAPLTEVGRSSAMAFPVSTVLAVPNLFPETYNFEFWQSSNGTSLDTLIEGPWSIDASAYSGGIVQKFDYVVDRGYNNTSPVNTGSQVWADPASNQRQIIDQRLAGAAKEDVELSMRGTGIRRLDEFNLLSGGGIELADVNEVFNPDDSIFIRYFQKVSTNNNSSGASDYSDVINVSANATVDITYKNKLINCTGASAVTTLTFPAFTSMSDQKMKISTNGMTGNYLKLQFATGNTVPFAGANRNVIYLSVGRVFEIMFKSNVPYVLSSITDAGYDVRGKRDFADDVKSHQRLRDGTVRQIADFPGSVEWIQTLPSSLIITTFASWNTDANKHKYYLNVAAGEFAFPNDIGMTHKGVAVGSAGRYEADGIKLADDTVKGVKETGQNTAKGALDNITTPGTQFDLTAVFDISTSGATETTIKNVGLLAVINL